MVAEQVSASWRVYPYRTTDMRNARLTGAASVVQGYYTRNGDHLDVHAVVSNLDDLRNTAAVAAQAGLRGSLNGASESIARAIDTRTRPFGTQNGEATKAWGEALNQREPAARAAALERAIAADPNFGEGYAELCELYAETGDNAKVQSVLKRGGERLSQFTDLERARFELASSVVRNDRAQRREALVALSRLVSTDAQASEALSQSELNARNFTAAADLLKTAVAIEPENISLLNQLGYAEAYRGDIDDARRTLERYRALQPSQPNPLDSLGEVHFFSGRFADAEKYFLEAQKIQPGFLGGVELLKAAQARYMQGNTAGADQLYSQFDSLRRQAGDPLADVRRAEWLYVSGRRAEALSAAQAAARSPNSDVAAYALCHLALWTMDSGDRNAAAAFAKQAAQQARGPSVQRLAAMCGFISGAVAEGSQPAPDFARAYASLFAHDAQRAAALLKPLYERTSPTTDGEIRTLYAWALVDSGHPDQARPLLERYPLPLGTSDEALFMTQAFPRFVALRGSKANTPARSAT